MVDETIPSKNLHQYLLEEEKIVFSGENVNVDGEAGYNFAVTDKRIIFGKRGKMHDIKLSSISSITWGRKRFPILFVIGLIFMILSFIRFLREKFIVYEYSIFGVYEPSIIEITLFIFGIILIAIFFIYQPEYLAIYTAGRSMKIRGKKEILEQLRIKATKVSYYEFE